MKWLTTNAAFSKKCAEPTKKKKKNWNHGPKSESSLCLCSAPNLSLKAISFPSRSWGQSFEILRVRGKGNIELTSTEFQCGGRNILSYSRSLHVSMCVWGGGGGQLRYITDRFKLWAKKNKQQQKNNAGVKRVRKGRACTRMCADILVCLLNEADNQSVRSPCLMIKGLRSLAA